MLQQGLFSPACSRLYIDTRIPAHITGLTALTAGTVHAPHMYNITYTTAMVTIDHGHGPSLITAQKGTIPEGAQKRPPLFD